ncbi:MAG: IgGFc-binding protein [Polyangiaceae bacterium]
MMRHAPSLLTRVSFGSTLVALAGLVASCSFDPAYRDVALALVPGCETGTVACRGESLARCDGEGAAATWVVIDACDARGLVCATPTLGCTRCHPKATKCDGAAVSTCNDDGSGYSTATKCDASLGLACRKGACEALCANADREKSNVGCEYWAVDLDNAVPTPSLNAAAQPFAVVLSNAEPDVPAVVTIEVDDALPGAPAKLRTVGSATIPPGSLEVFYLGSREVDGSPPGSFNTGTGTALTRNAFRIRSNFPIVAYQFNPLENVGVFSNDASQLLPTSALGGPYVIASWPQTIAASDNPDTNFGQNLRSFLTVVGTAPDTKISIKTRARVIVGPPLPQGVAEGQTFERVLQPFDVLNLETGDFLADFTGSTIEADKPVAVFAGSEASDAPMFASLGQRQCCADHLEEQATPTRAAGKSFVLSHMPNRIDANIRAGASLTPAPEPEVYRVVATHEGKTHVTTSLSAPDDAFDLDGVGAVRTITSTRDFTLTASAGVVIADVVVGQQAAGIPRGLPGGDPSLTYAPPVEQWRSDYVLLLPDKYAFDFLVLSAPPGAKLYMDGILLDASNCTVAPGDGLTPEDRKSPTPPFLSYRCPMSFPTISIAPDGTAKVDPARQNDGVHHLQGEKPFGVVVYGFDAFVSYAYAGGTELREINLR